MKHIEEQILLLSSRAFPSKADRNSLELLMRENSDRIDYLDWTQMIRIASLNGIAPFLYRGLEKIETISEKVRTELEKIYHTTLAWNVRNLEESMRVLQLLKENGIEAIPLKGALASETLFGDPGIYVSTDIDILVMPSELDEATSALVRDGYQYDRERIKDIRLTHYHIHFQKGKHSVEIHWKLEKRFFGIPPEFWWEDVTVMKHGNVEITCLSPERYIMYSVFRLFSHNFMPLKFLVFVAGVVTRHYDDIDWDKLLFFSGKYHMRRLMIFTLRLAHSTLDTRIPEHIISAACPGYVPLKAIVLSGVFREPKRPTVRKIIFLTLLDSPLHMIAGFLKRVFPATAELRMRYRIPENSRKIYVYYILNPFLLPFLMLRRKGH